MPQYSCFDDYSRVPHIGNHFLGFSPLFQNNSLLFYPMFFQKLSVSVSHTGVSYMRNSTVLTKKSDECSGHSLNWRIFFKVFKMLVFALTFLLYLSKLSKGLRSLHLFAVL